MSKKSNYDPIPKKETEKSSDKSKSTSTSQTPSTNNTTSSSPAKKPQPKDKNDNFIDSAILDFSGMTYDEYYEAALALPTPQSTKEAPKERQKDAEREKEEEAKNQKQTEKYKEHESDSSDDETSNKSPDKASKISQWKSKFPKPKHRPKPVKVSEALKSDMKAEEFSSAILDALDYKPNDLNKNNKDHPTQTESAHFELNVVSTAEQEDVTKRVNEQLKLQDKADKKK